MTDLNAAQVKVTVITATFNSAATILDALTSVDTQSYQAVEHIIVDGNSSDQTLELLATRTSPRRSVISEPDRGIYDALNKGIARSTGEVIGFLHSDDRFSDNHVLEDIAKAFSDPRIDIVYGDLAYVSKADESRIIRLWRSGTYKPRKLRRGWMPPHPTFYVRRTLYEKLGGFDVAYKISADYDNMLRLLSSSATAPAYINRVLVYMRTGGASNRSLKNVLRKSREDWQIMKRHGMNAMTALFLKNTGKLRQFLVV